MLARRLRRREVFVPLRHDPGHAQVDFGEAQAEIAGSECKIHFFAMDLPHSDACFVRAYLAETAEAFCDGHNAAFEFFGKVPRTILYDNTTLAVARIMGDGVRQRTHMFSELQSHYVFADRFGRPGKGHCSFSHLKTRAEKYALPSVHRSRLVGTSGRSAFAPDTKSGSFLAIDHASHSRSAPGATDLLPMLGYSPSVGGIDHRAFDRGGDFAGRTSAS